MKILIWIGVAFVVSQLWMRLAPSSVEKWHDAPIKQTVSKISGYRTTVPVRGSAAAALTVFDEIAKATPRTKVLAGRVAEGKITYITRSLFLGAPDYTTVLIERARGGSQLTIYGRLRFGIGDLGVNRTRIKKWLQVFETIE